MQTYLTPEPITCEVRNATGSVTVELSDTPTTTVELLASGNGGGGFLDDMFRSVWGGPNSVPQGDAVDDVVVEFENNRLIVDTEPAHRQWHTGFVVRISAPSGSGIRTRTESADIIVRGVPDRVEVKTSAGNVDVESTGRHASLRTVSGDIDVHDAADGTVDVAAVSGSLSIGVHAGAAAKVELSTVSGRARSDLPVQAKLDGAALTIKGRTVSGNVTLHAADAGSSADGSAGTATA